MRRLRRLLNVGERAILTSVGIFSLGLNAGCASGPGTDGNNETSVDATAGTTESGTTVGTTVGTTETTTMTGDGDGDTEELYPCMPGIPATTQVGRLLNREYAAALESLLGVTTIDGLSGGTAEQLLTTDANGAMDPYRWKAYQDVAEAVSTQVISGPNKAKFIACDPAVVPTCYADTIKGFGRKALRRPVTAAEEAKFMALTTIQPAGTPDQIAQTLLYAFLVYPSFIMATETGVEAATAVDTATPGAIKLTDHEVAVRLSRMLWGGLPDDILNKAADDGLLKTVEQIQAQAVRMIGMQAQSAPQVGYAHRVYMDMEDASSHWWKSDHDPALFPTFSTTAVASLSAEYDAFFETVIFNNGTFKDLFLSNKGFVNADNAPFYGLDPSGFGAELQPYEFDPMQRPGILTRAGFLDSFSNYDATSPIRRGAFMAMKIIGVKVGAPDQEAAKTQVPPGVYTTRREQIDALTSDISCKKCHQEAVNPPGYIMENFDAMGRWQETDRLGGAIVPQALVGFGDGDLRDITGAYALMQEIVTNPNSQKIYAQKIVSVAMNRFPNNADACIRDDLVSKLADDTYPILSLFTDITQAESFRLRTRGE